jgi:prepilin-type N-terminal cleavage/methylation domain
MNRLLSKKTNELSKKKKKGFTLVELIIVIAIIAILAAIAIPKFGEIRKSANEKADIATAKNIATVVANGIANQDIGVPSSSDGTYSLSSVGDTHHIDITGKIDGGTTPKLESGDSFSVIIKTNGNIAVKYTTKGTILYGQS